MTKANEKDEEKKTARERRAEKRRAQIEKGNAIAGIGKGSLEPTVTEQNYKIKLIKALNYYNSAFDDKDKKKWTLSYVSKTDAKILAEVDDDLFHSVGAIVRLLARDQFVAQNERDFIEQRIKELLKMGASAVPTSQSKPVDKKAQRIVSMQERVKSMVDQHASVFDGMIDEYITTKKEPDFAGYLAANAVSPQVSKQIPALYDFTLDQMRKAYSGEDADLVEGYSNFSKTELRKLIKIYESIGAACNVQAVKIKVQRKPRKRKEKPPHVLAAKVKYMKQFDELGLTSESPAKIVGSTEVWVYNTKYKKLQVYRASSGTLSIKGTTIIGYNIESSFGKSLRKPELLKTYVGMNKRTLGTTIKSLKTKDQAVNGRINEDCVIFKVFQ